jgi:outer membrane protein OmpA-like peptidoglycan-associated protein
VVLYVATMGSARAAVPGWSALPIPYDGAGLVGTGRAEIDEAGDVGLRLDLTYARRPLRLPFGGRAVVPVEDVLEARLSVDVGVWRRRLQLGVVAPASLALYSTAGRGLTSGAGQGSGYDVAGGELRAYVKAGLVETGRVRLAASAAAVGPMSSAEAAFRTDGVWGAELRLALDVVAARWLTLMANVGAKARPRFTVGYEVVVGGRGGADVRPIELGSELQWAFGAEASVHRRLAIAAELFGAEALDGAAGSALGRALAVALSGRVRVAPGMQVTVGVARSVAPDAVRADDVRVVAGLAWHPRERGAAPAGMGAAPAAAPAVMASPAASPVVASPAAASPTAASRPGAQAEEADFDGDGVPDSRDRCREEPETVNGLDDDDGCPDSVTGRAPTTSFMTPPRLRFARGEIALDKNWVEALAASLRAHPEVRVVRIEGHAFGERRAEELSERRALAVREALIARGIDPARLSAVGYGATRPIAGDAAESRRVEIVVVDEVKR